ncbi:zinc finger protein ZFPM1 [Eudromia elegans]
MSRRKQSNPRQIKRSLGEMEDGEDTVAGDASPSAREGAASDREGSSERDAPSPDGEPEAKDAPESPKEPEKQDPGESPAEPAWSGPDELALATQEGESGVRARRSLPEGFSWGPFPGSVHSEPASPGQNEASAPVTLVLGDESCWLSRLPLVPAEPDANAVIYSKDAALWCRTRRAVRQDEALRAFVLAEPAAVAANHTPKAEPADSPYPAALRSDIQLLPQQAGMAAILATAVVNKDVFPCKDCGIWYRSERNLQAHLLYYCASRASGAAPAADDKPKESYPNERVCPFPQCKKSCPSASSLEIHMRSHSGERPFVCLICLSAFTTKANCERHLKVHTDTLNGVCHSCGFISTTRDILYSHLVTNHMICQPGSKGEVYSPGPPSLPAGKPLAPGLSQPNNAPVLKCSLPGFLAEALPALPPRAVLQGPPPAPTAPPASPPTASVSPPTEAPDSESRAPSADAPSSSSSSSSSLSSSSEPVPPVRVKEEPEAPRSVTRAEVPGSPGAEPDSRTSSPRSLPSGKVKSELASPTPGSSPVPSEPGAGTAGGTVFLPQYLFGHEAAVVPQASEILAKMSELVHSRLKQGQGTGPPALYGAGAAPAPKGATCFECEITFNNVNNYYVHKRLYCSSRHVAEDSAPAPRKPKAAPKAAAAAAGGEGPAEGEGCRAATPPEPRAEEGRCKAGSPEAASARGSEGSPSPGSSVDEGDEDPSKTLCEACNIRFSRHETYAVHKRFYCASRHDPPLRRPAGATAAAKAPPPPQPLRTRKRRKLYELHGAPGPARRPTHTEAAATLRPTPPPPPPDADGPIDLSKKPRAQGGEAAPLPPLADYHECTACRVSFHSLDGYLAHKKYQCPATPLQPATLRRLQRMKDAAGETTPRAAGLAACPYCPLNGAPAGELAEHLRSAHGLAEAAGSAEPPAASPARPRRDSLNNGRDADGSPRPPPSPPASPEAPRDAGRPPAASPPPPLCTDKEGGAGKGAAGTVPNGNPRYCRLCNIRFSSLSTFIAHKKYYCSSHAAEHVK